MVFVYKMAETAGKVEKDFDPKNEESMDKLSTDSAENNEKYVSGCVIGQKQIFTHDSSKNSNKVECTPVLVDMRRLILANSTENIVSGVRIL